ncbi:LEA type 2 family protein [bacterium]|nr:LEA type 2 family protein [bacterium]
MRNLAVFLFLLVSACSISKQIKEAKEFARCEFHIRSISQVYLAGEKIDGIKSVNDLGLKKATKILTVAATGSLPLTFNVNVVSHNPNDVEAGINKLEWIILVDQQEWLKGTLDRAVHIAPDSSVEFPVSVSADLKQSMQGKNKEALLNLAFNLSGENQKQSNIVLKIKPSVEIAGKIIEYPGYVDISFTAENGKVFHKKN